MSTNPTIPLNAPALVGNELAYLRECIESNWVSYVGPFVPRFEEAVAKFIGTRHAVATNSGTAALHLALLVAGVQPGDEVLLPTLSFIAPANAVTSCGAHPVFMDVTPDYWQMDCEKVADFLAKECRASDGRLVNRRTGRPVTTILPVHALGHPVDMDPIVEMARRSGLRVIEDAAEALGARYRDGMVGTFGDLACFSFNGNKIVTAGGGGIIVTNDAAWAARARYLSTQARDAGVEATHGAVGYNYRLTNLQAAVGLAQMEVVEEHLRIKRRIASRYTAELDDLQGIVLPKAASWATPNHWLSTIRMSGRAGLGRPAVESSLAQRGIQARPVWLPIHRQRPYRECQTYRIEVADEIHREALSLPSSVGLDEADQHRVISAIRQLADTPAADDRPAASARVTRPTSRSNVRPYRA